MDYFKRVTFMQRLKGTVVRSDFIYINFIFIKCNCKLHIHFLYLHIGMNIYSYYIYENMSTQMCP